MLAALEADLRAAFDDPDGGGGGADGANSSSTSGQLLNIVAAGDRAAEKARVPRNIRLAPSVDPPANARPAVATPRRTLSRVAGHVLIDDGVASGSEMEDGLGDEEEAEDKSHEVPGPAPPALYAPFGRRAWTYVDIPDTPGHQLGWRVSDGTVGDTLTVHCACHPDCAMDRVRRRGKARGQGRPLGIMMLWATAPQRLVDLFPELSSNDDCYHNSRAFKKMLGQARFHAHRADARRTLFERVPQLVALDLERARADDSGSEQDIVH